MVVLATAIDIGATASNRNSSSSYAYGTVVDRTNPANGTGKITFLAIYPYQAMQNIQVATFYCPDPVNFPEKLSTRDSESIANTSGYTEYLVDLDVVEGDFIGLYFTAGQIEATNPTTNGTWKLAGDQIPCTNATFAAHNFTLSIYGTGATPAVATTNIFMGVNF